MTTTITLEAIRKHGPCESGWKKLLNHLGKTAADDEPLELITVLESNGLDNALWYLRVLPKSMDNAVRLLVCNLVEPAMAFVPEGETKPQAALAAARAFARGEITPAELNTARVAARAVAEAAWDAAWDAAWAAAWDAAWDAARTAASAAAMAAADAAAGDAARAAWDAAREQQEIVFRAWLKEHQI